jgi:glycosyltransferase involved in cell wall biosynthesis
MSKKVKIFVDAEVLIHPNFSGIGHYTLEILRALDSLIASKPNIQITLGVYYRSTAKVHSYGFRNFKYRRSPFSLRTNNGLKIRNLQPFYDLLFGKHIYLFPNFTSWPLLFSKSIPIIYDLSYERFPKYADPPNQVFLSNNVRKSIERADRILSISKFSKKEISSFYKTKKKIDVLYPGIDQSVFFRWPAEGVKKVKANYGIHGKYILYIGNLEPRKNLDMLLLAYSKLSKSLRDEYSLLLVGGFGWNSESIFKAIEKLRMEGNFIQMPSKYVSDRDRPAILSGASLFVYPSKYEGFGIPPVEAMACGVPVISSDNSSLPEAVGEAAKMIPAGSHTKLTLAMERVLTDKDLRQKMTVAGFKQADKFSWNESARKLLDILEDMGNE